MSNQPKAKMRGGWIDEALRVWTARGGEGFALAPMRRYTTFRIGGPADLLLRPHSQQEVVLSQQLAREMNQPLTVLGGGSNVLVRDGGIRGVVLRTAGVWETVAVEGYSLRASGGARLPLLAAEARRAGLSGLEFCAVIPGTVGGAVIQNAGAGRQCVADSCQWVRVLEPDGATRMLTAPELAFGHRTSSLKGSGCIVLEACFECVPEAEESIAARVAEHRSRRRQRLPLSQPSAGSVFQQIPGSELPVGALIEQAGCKGWRRGGAMVSERHANFIVNVAEATAEDVLSLVREMKEAVFERYGLTMTLEITVIGTGQ